jgi:nucleoside-diphosphate-sugar epimerase
MCLPRSNAELVLVTGVDGYLGSQLAVAFLDHGFNVRGTVESLLSSDDLMKTLAQYGKAGRFSLTTVTDTTTPTAFDEAVRGRVARPRHVIDDPH